MFIDEKNSLANLQKKTKLAKILNCDVEYLKNFSDYSEVKSFDKRVGPKTRRLFNADPNHKKILRKINKLLLSMNIPDYVYGGRPNRDYLSNAFLHKKNPYIQTADIRSFFPSTHESYVYGFFKNKLLMSEDVSKILTDLTTYSSSESPHYPEKSLPQGFPTSTIMSYLAYFDMFNGIYKQCRDRNIHFSLFVDDMTFSSDVKIPKSFIRHINNIVTQYDLSLHPNKIRRFSVDQPKLVTGVIIDPKTNNFHIPNKLHKKIYTNIQNFHSLNVNTYTDYVNLKRIILSLKGQLASCSRIDQEKTFNHIIKVIQDVEIHFIVPSVKGATHRQLYEEYISFVSFR
ncbi:reverse transcriptase (RNA-dependent DNA polymerase) [Sinobaca qinghaiensis]|uniref:Reverse transcriptase (RNA-dependent DNA polymerase) n=1 Tax=Sinobaca qinghaiensis TaxID=342944 RepID=A0A419VTT3_9BACL|nr:reverse transcriptase family protein [Sinobaca qinghaiensis]RKD84120.1 reverse transcriptase (RNA-dependent DNA polymerase) [Sinobaca qinghaiensis]